jgi:DnaJ-class molecular chaperone
MFGARFQQPHQRQQQARMNLWITLTDAAQGGRRTVSIGTNIGTVAAEIEIPQSIDDGDSVQYPGIGPGGIDLIVTFRIHPDPRWIRQGLNLTTERTVDIWSLILGTQIEVQDILKTTLSVNVAPNTQPGTLIRLRGRGMQARNGQIGDLFVRVQTAIPKDIPEDLLELIRSKYQK